MNSLFIAEEKEKLLSCYGKEYMAGRTVTNDDFFKCPYSYQDIKVLFSTWGMPVLTQDEIKKYFPKLELVLYGAGSVKAFALPYLELGIHVSSAWVANAIPVAEWSMAQIILANKGYYQMHRRYKNQGIVEVLAYAEGFSGNYGGKIGLIGLGSISRKIIDLLRKIDLKVYVYDTYIGPKEANELGVEYASLDYIFKECQTVSNHLPNKANNKKILNYNYFSKMKDNGTFINTGRGAQVDLDGLIRAMKEKPSRTALLDVTDPDEPLPSKHDLWQVNNIFVSPHRAGSMVHEVRRMGDYMKEEYSRYCHNEKLVYELTLDKYNKMA